MRLKWAMMKRGGGQLRGLTVSSLSVSSLTSCDSSIQYFGRSVDANEVVRERNRLLDSARTVSLSQFTGFGSDTPLAP